MELASAGLKKRQADVPSIDPHDGRVVGAIDMNGLLPASDFVPGKTDVLNGIAYDPQGDRLFVTGKNWPKLFEIRLKARQTPPS